MMTFFTGFLLGLGVAGSAMILAFILKRSSDLSESARFFNARKTQANPVLSLNNRLKIVSMNHPEWN